MVTTFFKWLVEASFTARLEITFVFERFIKWFFKCRSFAALGAVAAFFEWLIEAAFLTIKRFVTTFFKRFVEALFASAARGFFVEWLVSRGSCVLFVLVVKRRSARCFAVFFHWAC